LSSEYNGPSGVKQTTSQQENEAQHSELMPSVSDYSQKTPTDKQIRARYNPFGSLSKADA
jgi:hypothetical protein